MLSNLKIGTRITGAFALVVIILVLVIGIGYSNLGRYASASGWNVHTYEVLEETDNVLVSLINIETGQRGFLVAGKDEFLEPLNEGKKGFAKQSKKDEKILLEFVSANPTGPLHIGHARGAIAGDSLARVGKYLGYGQTK